MEITLNACIFVRAKLVFAATWLKQTEDLKRLNYGQKRKQMTI
jgi:hypothetical protein